MRLFAILFLVLSFTGCQQNPPHAPGVLVMQRRVSFPGIELVARRIREECNVATNLSSDIRYYARQHFSKVDLVDAVSAGTPGKALFVRVARIEGGDRGTQWSGNPYMVVEGVLWNAGVKIGDFVAQRQSWGTVDSCMSLARVSRALGKDIGKWLASPLPNARLGDAK